MQQRFGRGALTIAAITTAVVAVVASAACTQRAAKQAVEPAPVAAPPREPTPAERAVALYDEGKYAEARPILEALEADGQLTGPLLYRLGYCIGQAGDMGRQNETMQRALAELQKEAAVSNNLEVSFFLANSLSNVGRPAEAKTIAADATARVTGKEWPDPTKPIDQFRLGKLYQDQDVRDEAVRRYRAALAGWQAESVTAPGYEKWARRYLAQDSFARADFRAAEADLKALVALGGATASEYDRLAVSRVKLRDWNGAADAWSESVRLDPANADRPRYCRNLALLAATAGDVPTSTPTGASFGAASKEDLEALMSAQAKVLRDARTEAAGGISPERRVELDRAVVGARGTFVAAGLEYATRYYDIRQTAFTSGYAPLIFHPEEWSVDAPQ